jgi:hypothetical protein
MPSLSTRSSLIKSITRYDSGGILSGTGPTDITITAVTDLSKTSINLLSMGGDNQANQGVSVKLINTTTVRIIHSNLADGWTQIEFEVIEYN